MTEFSDLNDYIVRWGLASAEARLQQRVHSKPGELQEFYDAVSPRLEDIIKYLNQYPLEAIPETLKPLAWMALALCEVDDAIHVWKATNLDLISDPCHWRTKTSFNDYQ